MNDATKRALVIAETLDASASKIGEAIPARLNLPASRVIRIAKQAININPSLADCTGQSIANACMKAAADGLVCDGREAALVPYKRRKDRDEWMEAQYIIMYRGMIKMMYRSEHVAAVEIVNVYENEFNDPERWDYARGLNPVIMHRPLLQNKERGQVAAIYSIVTMRGGQKSANVMTIEDVLDTVGQRPLQINPLWKLEKGGKQTHNYIEMARKTVLRAHAKLLPFESDISAAFDDHGSSFDDAYDPDPDAAPGEPEIQVPRGKVKGAAAAKLNQKGPQPPAERMDPETGELSPDDDGRDDASDGQSMQTDLI